MQSKKPQNKFARRDRLLEIEAEAQKLWENKQIYDREVDFSKPKYFINFPYPYMNGKLHLGHAYSTSKAEFMARYKTLKGFNTLFPFSYHCTGMPISAAAKKLKEEIETKGIEKLKEIVEERKKDSKSHPMTQYEILLNCEVPQQEIPSFIDSHHWLDYFPEKARNDIKLFGLAVDHRRSFITTSKNPYYNSFIEWQFTQLKKKNVIIFGKRPSIYSPKDKQICADHDRSVGEEVLPQEYTLIKIEVTDSKKQEIFGTDKKVFLIAATLRPETMYGQTNCFVLPSGEYGLYQMPGDEYWVCSHKSMKNMSYQYITQNFAEIIEIKKILGEKIIGLSCKAPLTSYETIFVWPMFSISMEKGTGVVTSVPSDAPDDYAVLVDLQKKKPLREKFGLTDEQVMNFKPISIIDVPEYSDLSAVKAYTDFKISSMNDQVKLNEAKAEVYLKGFYKGIMKVGEWKGESVESAKQKVKKKLVEEKQGVIYYEPESQCISRSGDICVVALCDQWYINYGQEIHKEVLKKFVSSDQFNKFNDNLTKCFVDALDWLKEWGCSRSFGLGTTLPWDQQFIIESLSDSTIYMAYYTISHFLQGDVEGKTLGLLNVKAEDITLEDWDTIFLHKDRKNDSKISEEKLMKMRESFEYWYPFDLRCSGKDLIKNHLTMSLYNHLFIWGEKYLPRGIFCNGWILVDGDKMSKSKGNFFTLSDFCKQFSADASRIGLALSGDTIEDANVELKEVDQAILKLSQLEKSMKEIAEGFEELRESSLPETKFFDEIFENQIKLIIYKTDQSYQKLIMREVVKQAFFSMLNVKEEYKINCGNVGIRKDLAKFWLKSCLIILSPVTPHFCEIMWREVYLKLLKENEKDYSEFVEYEKFPEIDYNSINLLIIKKYEALVDVGKNLRSAYINFQKKNSKKKIKKIYIITSDEFKDWQIQVLDILRECQQYGNDWIPTFKKQFANNQQMQKIMAFARFRMKDFEVMGEEALDSKISFSEYDLYKENLSLISKQVIEESQIEIVNANDSEKIDCQNVKQSIEHALPRRPIIIIDVQQLIQKKDSIQYSRN